MTHDSQFIDGLFTKQEQKAFLDSASKREPAMRWDSLFPDGGDELVLPLLQEGEKLSSLDDEIEKAY